jgi:hypothetical protein
MVPISQENTRAVSDALREELPAEARSQVKFIFTDDPSPALWAGLKAMDRWSVRVGVRFQNRAVGAAWQRIG